MNENSNISIGLQFWKKIEKQTLEDKEAAETGRVEKGGGEEEEEDEDEDEEEDYRRML